MAAAAGPDTTTAETATAKDYYFDSYAHFGIHGGFSVPYVKGNAVLQLVSPGSLCAFGLLRCQPITEEMLKDEVRTMTYRKGIFGSRHRIEGKVVMDVGCGTGILSMFAARAGAKHVYAIEMSSIGDQARQIIADNGLSDKITVLRGKAEEVELPDGVNSVDIIVSEWMGYALLYESMLPSVLHCRDKWLSPGGAMLPDRAQILLCGIEDADYKDSKINWWDNVYGFNMSCVKALASAEPLVDTVNPGQVATDFCQVLDINCITCTKADLTYTAPFKLTAERDDYLHAIVMHFDCQFGSSHTPVEFSTGPLAEYTHWKQTVFYLPDVLAVRAGEEVTGTISCTPNAKNPRDMDFVLMYEFNGSIQQAQASAEYKMR